VVQAAAKIVLEPIFEADFKDDSYGFRPKKSATDALEAIRLTGGRGHRWVVDGDIKGFFDSIDQTLLLDLLKRRISDRRALKLVRQWLHAGVMEEGGVKHSTLGTPQGGVISPLLANVFLHALDDAWEHEGKHLGRLVRYADDFVVLCKTEAAADEALRRLKAIFERLRLELHPDKTKIVGLGEGSEGFVFLGCYLRVVRSRYNGKTYVFRWPSPKAMKNIRTKIRDLTDRPSRAGMKDLREVIADLNPVLRGWCNYFRSGNASKKFTAIDRYVWKRLVRLLARRGGQRGPRDPGRIWREWPHTRLVQELGLYKLLGTTRYPGRTNAA
jgi:group II intron reverse transcriptase/maturase